jgi:hypothetical protein
MGGGGGSDRVVAVPVAEEATHNRWDASHRHMCAWLPHVYRHMCACRHMCAWLPHVHMRGAQSMGCVHGFDMYTCVVHTRWDVCMASTCTCAASTPSSAAGHTPRPHLMPDPTSRSPTRASGLL